MKEKQILFSAPMVRAILDGRKTQTRRVVKKAIPDESFINAPYNGFAFVGQFNGGTYTVPFLCPYGQPGDRLWVRETWQAYRQVNVEYNECEEMESPKDRHHGLYEPVYRADGKSQPNKWFPAIHMPRDCSRITLDITNVRVERLHDISEADALAEGVEREGDGFRDYLMPETQVCATAKDSFLTLWQSINGPDSWAANPWVWVIEFKRVTL